MPSAPGVVVDATPSATYRTNLITIVLGTWFTFGLFLDAWAHSNLTELESFFTPWHGVFYSGFVCTAGWILLTAHTAWRAGGSRIRAIPPGYAAATVAVAGFAGVIAVVAVAVPLRRIAPRQLERGERGLQLRVGLEPQSRREPVGGERAGHAGEQLQRLSETWEISPGSGDVCRLLGEPPGGLIIPVAAIGPAGSDECQSVADPGVGADRREGHERGGP